jgi:hypothetical protein
VELNKLGSVQLQLQLQLQHQVFPFFGAVNATDGLRFPLGWPLGLRSGFDFTFLPISSLGNSVQFRCLWGGEAYGYA